MAQEGGLPTGSPPSGAPFDQADIDQRDAEAQRLFSFGQFAEAERLFRQNLAASQTSAGDDHSETLIALGSGLLWLPPVMQEVSEPMGW